MLDVREAAGLARRNPETIRRWIWSGRLAARRQGRRLLVARRDLEALLDPGSTLSLAGWLRIAERERPAAARGTATAADLVFDDRRDRPGGARAGR